MSHRVFYGQEKFGTVARKTDRRIAQDAIHAYWRAFFPTSHSCRLQYGLYSLTLLQAMEEQPSETCPILLQFHVRLADKTSSPVDRQLSLTSRATYEGFSRKNSLSERRRHITGTMRICLTLRPFLFRPLPLVTDFPRPHRNTVLPASDPSNGGRPECNHLYFSDWTSW